MVHQICILIWKNLLVRRNRYITTTVEVLIPLVLLLLINTTLSHYVIGIDTDPIEFEPYQKTKCTTKMRSHYDSIIYEPSTPFTRLLMTQAACFAGYKKTSAKPGSLSDNNTYFSIGVRFEVPNDTTTVPVLNYTLFPTSKAFEKSGNLWRYFGTSIPRFSIPTMFSVVELQRAIDSSYLDLKNISTPKLRLENTDVYDRKPKVFSLAIFLTLFIAISLMVPPTVSRIVEEKQTGATELMLMMGVVRWQLWVAKFVDVIIFVCLTVSGMVLFLCVPFRSDSSHVNIPPLVLWALLMYGFAGIIFFLFCLSCFFEKPTQAAVSTEIIWFSSFLLQYPIFGFVRLPKFVKYFYVCLFPHVSLMAGVNILLKFDDYEKEIRLTERLSGREDALSLLDILLATTTSILLYSVLIWYLERVKPGKYGVPLPYNFFLKKSYWFPREVITAYSNGVDEPRNNFEPVSACLKPGVCIERVSKVYRSADKASVIAVDDVSLDFYTCEISGLLGHNGAGKTSLFSMITGLSAPTSGKIVVNGYDLGINVREARRSLGFCPQQDMLFNNLTAVQTLQFYGVVKGLTLKAAKVEADKLIIKLKLTNVKNTQASKLSGGQKRKVSLAIAIIGGSQVLVLDEPTAGMDPEIRREVWEILLGFRSERTILLTTHFMEEADALCDRIAILDHGKIKCYGSPMFLKSKYGKGYVLSVVVPDAGKSRELVDYIKQFVTAKLTSQNIRTLCFQLPESEVSHFAGLFAGLEEKQAAGEIVSYSINFSTLEDAFLGLKSGHQEVDEFDIVDSPGGENPEKALPKGKDLKCRLIVNQFWALLFKKSTYFSQNYKLYLFFSVLPSLLVILTSYSLYNNPAATGKFLDTGSLTYSLDLYPSSLVLYSMPAHATFEETLFQSMVNKSGSTPMKVDDIKKAVYDMFRDDFHKYARELTLAADFKQGFQIYHNYNAVYMVPVALNFFHNFLLKYWYSNDGIVTSLNVTYSHKNTVFVPPPAVGCSQVVQILPDLLGVQTMFYLLEPIRERFHGAKELQLMRTSVPLYWFSHLFFDVFTHFFFEAGLTLTLRVLGDATVTKYPVEFFLGFLFWGAGLIIFQYVISTLIKNSATAFSITLMACIFFSFSSYDVIESEGALSFLKFLYPSYFLKSGIKQLCAGEDSAFLWYLILYCCVLFLVLVVKDLHFLSPVVHSLSNRFLKVNYSLEEEKDELVKEEEEFVVKLIGREVKPSGLIVKDLRRCYWKGFRRSPAVRGISFAVNRGECFGLLGVNGAGKTTTFRILTGAIPASDGICYACSERLSLWNRRRYLFSIGYCPQFDGLIPFFKGAELLEFFALMRGVPRSRVKTEVYKWIERIGLLEYANKNCKTYSGGNQRRLSTAIALIGEDPLIFLDEPTTGVDPLSRRSIWNVIRDVQKEGRSVVLTSHSMDECEALCSRLGIMVKGRFRCIGETTTLKDRFGRGYSVQLKLSSSAALGEVDYLKKHVEEAFQPGCNLVDDHVTLLQYHLTNKRITWESLFRQLNLLKEKFSVLESYTASATTLEQIFIYFARSAGETV